MRTQTAVKKTSRGGRIWLENKQALEFSGFMPGSRFDIASNRAGIVLISNPDGKSKVSSCSRNGVSRPIIDMHSKGILAIFPAGTELEITYTASIITIKAV